jgi:hypothetical protein
MPTDAKPLFRPDALRNRLTAFTLPSAAFATRTKLTNWTDLLASKAAEKMKETELLADFIRDIFGGPLDRPFFAHAPAANAPLSSKPSSTRSTCRSTGSSSPT